MALAFDAVAHTTNTTNQTSGGTTTYSHTVGSGSNLLLIVAVSFWSNGSSSAGLSGLTYNGTSMTLVSGTAQTSSSGAFYTAIYALPAPVTGTNSIVATVAGQCDKLGLASISFTGADQTTGIDAAGGTIGTSGTVTQSLTTTAASEYLVDAVSHLSANTASSNSNTSIYNDGAVGAGTASQYGSAASAGSNSMSWTYPDPGDQWAYSVAAVKAASGGGGSTIPPGPLVITSIPPFMY